METNQTQVEFSHVYRIFGYYLMVIWLLGTLLNGSLLYVLFRSKAFNSSSTNVFIIGLLFADFMGAFFGIPFPAFSLLSGKWIFGRFACIFEAIVTYFAGCSNIYILSLISVDRYIVIRKCFASRTIKVKQSYALLGAVYFLAFAWTMMPLFGWSSYDFEGVGVSCSIKWEDRSLNVVSYNMAILVFVYLIPMLVIFISNIKIYATIRERCRNTSTNINEQCSRRKFLMERRIFHTISFIIAGFTAAWTPYALTVCFRVFFTNENFPPILSTIPSLFAKTGIVWNPLIYVIRNGNFRRLR